MDHHVRATITSGLRRRGVDCLTTLEDGHDTAADDVLLKRATLLGRILFSQDRDLLVIANQWLLSGRTFAGLVFARQRTLSTRLAIRDLELIAKVYDLPDMLNRVEFIPFP